jgi:hypothetical protein
MLESLKKLSDRATPGEAYAYMDHYHLIAHPAGSTYVGDQKLIALCACGDKAGANVHFLATLWTLYRRGQLHDETALAEAEARGRRQGLEEAATHLEDRADYFNRSPGYRNWDDAARSYRSSAKEVRSLASSPEVTRQGESTGGGHDG